MRLEVHDGLKNPQNIMASRVVVYDDYDNPIALVIEVDNNQYVATTAGQKQFTSILKAMGINQTLVVQKSDPKNYPPLQ